MLHIELWLIACMISAAVGLGFALAAWRFRRQETERAEAREEADRKERERIIHDTRRRTISRDPENPSYISDADMTAPSHVSNSSSDEIDF